MMTIFHHQSTSLETKLYTISGQEEYMDEEGYPRVSSTNQSALAKAVENKLTKEFIPNNNRVKRYKYYVKADPNRFLLNPLPNYTIGQKNNREFVNNVCKTGYDFLEVSRGVFYKYLSFLCTKNPQILNAIQREIK